MAFGDLDDWARLGCCWLGTTEPLTLAFWSLSAVCRCSCSSCDWKGGVLPLLLAVVGGSVVVADNLWPAASWGLSVASCFGSECTRDSVNSAICRTRRCRVFLFALAVRRWHFCLKSQSLRFHLLFWVQFSWALESFELWWRASLVMEALLALNWRRHTARRKRSLTSP